MALAELVEPSFSTRWARDGFGGNLTLNFQFTSNLRIVLTGYMRFNRGKNHDELNVLGIGRGYHSDRGHPLVGQ